MPSVYVLFSLSFSPQNVAAASQQATTSECNKRLDVYIPHSALRGLQQVPEIVRAYHTNVQKSFVSRFVRACVRCCRRRHRRCCCIYVYIHT